MEHTIHFSKEILDAGLLGDLITAITKAQTLLNLKFEKFNSQDANSILNDSDNAKKRLSYLFNESFIINNWCYA